MIIARCLLLLTLFAGTIALAADPVSPPSSTAAARPAKPAVRKPGPATPDRLQLDSTAITGNRELPKVMSIVPWKAPEPPAGPDRPMGSLVDEVMSPIDRDEFQREVAYYRDLTTPHPSAPPSQAATSSGASQP